MGQIKITVQTEQRMEAITNMAKAIYELSKALGVGTHVAISDCNFRNVANGPVINIDAAEKVTETTVEKFDNDH